MAEHKDAYSPLVNDIYRMFERTRQNHCTTLLTYWDAWQSHIHYVGVPAGHDVWQVNDYQHRKNGYTLLMALDLAQPFEAQFPRRFHQIETLDAFALTPLICVPDAAGINPAQMRAAFERAALKAPPPALHAIDNPNAHNIERVPLAQRSRDHLRLVIT